jgi:tetratricopeptide (TPR) repeat protein
MEPLTGWILTPLLLVQAVLVVSLSSEEWKPSGMPESAAQDLRTGIAELNRGYDQWSISSFQTCLKHFEHAAVSAPAEPLPLYWQAVAHFHLATYRLYARTQDRDKKGGEKNIEQALILLEKVIVLDQNDAESHALYSTLTGMKIDLHPLSALWLGPKVMKHKDAAERLAPDNPRANYLMGVSLFNGPAMLGGKKEALTHLLRAESLYDKEAATSVSGESDLRPRWGRGACLIFIARYYRDTKETARARQYYEKALQADAEDTLAREELSVLTSTGR